MNFSKDEAVIIAAAIEDKMHKLCDRAGTKRDAEKIVKSFTKLKNRFTKLIDGNQTDSQIQIGDHYYALHRFIKRKV